MRQIRSGSLNVKVPVHVIKLLVLVGHVALPTPPNSFIFAETLPTQASTQLSPKDRQNRADLLQLARGVVAKVAAQDPATISDTDLNGAAEAAYLAYCISPNTEGWARLRSDLETLWKMGDKHRTAVRLVVVASLFDVPTLSESRQISEAMSSKNALVSFCHVSRCVRAGLLGEARQTLTAVAPDCPASTAELQGLQALRTLVQRAADLPEKEAALKVWQLYGLSEWVDLAVVTNVFSTTGLRHVFLNDDAADKAVLARMRAAKSLLENSELLRTQLLGMNLENDLRLQLKVQGMVGELLPDSVDRYLKEMEQSMTSADQVRDMTSRWMQYPSESISPQLADQMITEGQVKTLARVLPPTQRPKLPTN